MKKVTLQINEEGDIILSSKATLEQLRIVADVADIRKMRGMPEGTTLMVLNGRIHVFDLAGNPSSL